MKINSLYTTANFPDQLQETNRRNISPRMNGLSLLQYIVYRDIHSHQHLTKYLSNEMVRTWAKSSSFSRGRKKLQAKELNEGRTACALLPAVTMSLVSSPYLRSQPSPRGGGA